MTERDYENNIAIMKGARNGISDDYFKARPQLDNGHERKIFESGFDRG